MKLFMALLMVSLATPAMAKDQILMGKVSSVHDGDTFTLSNDVGDFKIRLLPADTPEIKQTCSTVKGHVFECGVRAKSVMEDIALNKDVECNIKKRSYGRLAAYCYVNGIDLGLTMVASGYAWVDPRYATKAQQGIMDHAIKSRVGFWDNGYSNPKDGFQNPCEFRNPKNYGKCVKK